MSDKKVSTSKTKHPTTAKMVEIAIQKLNDRNGSSLQAIKKFISTNFDIIIENIYARMKKYLKAAVTDGTLVQVTGSGAYGRFKISKNRKKEIEKDEKVKDKKKVQKKEKEEKKSPSKKEKVTKKKKLVPSQQMPTQKKKTMSQVKKH